MARAFVLRVGHDRLLSAGAGSYQLTGQGVTLLYDAGASSPVLARVGTTFQLDGVAIKQFGLRTANAIQDDTIAQRLIDAFPTMLTHGMQAICFSFMGGRATDGGNSAFQGFNADGTLVTQFADRAVALIQAAETAGIVWWAQCFYQGRDQFLTNDEACREAVRSVTTLLGPYRGGGLHLINEPGHAGFDHAILTTGAGQVELYEIAKDLDPARICYASHAVGANDGWTMDTWGRNGIGTGMGAGDVCVEYVRLDEYNAPGVFTSGEISNTESHAATAFNVGGYWFYHAAWHQKADAAGWPSFSKGGAGTSGDPGVAFAWDAMAALEV